MLFSLPEIVPDKKIRVDFEFSDISSNGGLLLVGNILLHSPRLTTVADEGDEKLLKCEQICITISVFDNDIYLPF
jgi:hypothetical protein